jgi:hypothetical protein
VSAGKFPVLVVAKRAVHHDKLGSSVHRGNRQALNLCSGEGVIIVLVASGPSGGRCGDEVHK